jgi:hypothetical protein
MNTVNSQIFPLFFLALPLIDTAKAITNFIRDAPKREAQRDPDAGGGDSGERLGLTESMKGILGI